MSHKISKLLKKLRRFLDQEGMLQQEQRIKIKKRLRKLKAHYQNLTQQLESCEPDKKEAMQQEITVTKAMYQKALAHYQSCREENKENEGGK